MHGCMMERRQSGPTRAATLETSGAAGLGVALPVKRELEEQSDEEDATKEEEMGADADENRRLRSDGNGSAGILRPLT